ncbi:MAG: T9SS type A sorting domain-containing protein [Bacteroidetes bacterium]|nr:T9SS type A sorting domain-containing protein [Bacteroidota bacterium]
MIKTLLIVFGLFVSNFICSQSLSPEVIANSGGYYSSTNATLSWTIGESIIETSSNLNNILTQGFQQSSYSVTAIEEYLNSDYNINVYPNPVNEFVTINISSEKQIQLTVELKDLKGKILVTKIINGNNLQIDLSQFANSIYFLKISTTEGKMLKSYKIQKVN